jgi:hypothetical protein
VENAIAIGRRNIRNALKSTRKKATTASKASDTPGSVGSGASDDGISGDEGGKMMDELKFLSGRRFSMPGSLGDAPQGKTQLDEEQRRLKFLSQFTDSPGLGAIGGGMDNSSTTQMGKNNRTQNPLLSDSDVFVDANDMEGDYFSDDDEDDI